RRSLRPLLVEEELRPAAYALQSTYGTFGMMVGPALGGLLIGAFGLTSAYAVDAGTYCVALAVFGAIAAAPPVVVARTATASSVLEGWRFLRGHSIIMSTFGIDLLAMVFGMPRALFPALAVRLHGGPTLYGLLLSSAAGGAFRRIARERMDDPGTAPRSSRALGRDGVGSSDRSGGTDPRAG